MDAMISDEVLLSRYRAGDVAAFEALYARYRDSLFRFMRRQCATHALAEELFQDVWLGIVRGVREFSAENAFRAYLFRAARNRLIDEYRSSGRRGTFVALDDSDMTQLPHSDVGEPEQQLIGEQALQSFTVALAALPEEQRSTFLMYQESGLPLAAVADAMSSTYEATKSRLRYAVTKLRAALGEGHD